MQLNASSNYEQLRLNRNRLEEVLAVRRVQEEESERARQAFQQQREGAADDSLDTLIGSLSPRDLPRSPASRRLIKHNPAEHCYFNIRLDAMATNARKNAEEIQQNRSHIDEVIAKRRQKQAAA